MALPVPTPAQERILVKISEIEIANRTAHVTDKMNATLLASWRDTGSAITVIPSAGEVWTARREGYIWYLENRLDSTEDQAFIEGLVAGDAVLSAKATLYLQGEQILLNGEAPLTGDVSWEEITNKPTTFAPSTHDHDDRYYTEGEVDSAIAAAREAAWPVGSVFIAVSSTNPATLLGFGTWTLFGQGRTLVGQNVADTDFDTAEETGGAKTHTLTESEIPAHTHDYSANATMTDAGTQYLAQRQSTSGGTAGTRTTNPAGGGGAHNNMPPYIVVYMWKRTA